MRHRLLEGVGDVDASDGVAGGDPPDVPPVAALLDPESWVSPAHRSLRGWGVLEHVGERGVCLLGHDAVACGLDGVFPADTWCVAYPAFRKTHEPFCEVL